jgi:hypothetical protein
MSPLVPLVYRPPRSRYLNRIESETLVPLVPLLYPARLALARGKNFRTTLRDGGLKGRKPDAATPANSK